MHSVTALPIISLLSLLTPIQARISGISLPTTITPNTNIAITLITEDYIQFVQDVAIAFGIAPAGGAHDGELGTFWAGQSKMIGPGESPLLSSVDVLRQRLTGGNIPVEYLDQYHRVC